jgi:hypothetical protein
MSQNDRIREADLYPAVETYLREVGGTAPLAAIRRSIPAYVTLSPLDRLPSPTRPREELWEQLVRNIVCHRDSDGNPIKEGRFVYTKRRLSLPQTAQLGLFDNDNEGGGS